MTWSDPRTFVDGEVERARYFNAIADNMRVAVAYYANTPALESTASTVFTDLATIGPKVTCPVGSTSALVIFGAYVSNTVAVSSFGGMAIAITEGPVTAAAADTGGMFMETSANTNRDQSGAWMQHQVGLTPGTYTFQAKYRTGSTNNARFGDRWLYVRPLPGV